MSVQGRPSCLFTHVAPCLRLFADDNWHESGVPSGTNLYPDVLLRTLFSSGVIIELSASRIVAYLSPVVPLR
jgi:hypothetical protein